MCSRTWYRFEDRTRARSRKPGHEIMRSATRPVNRRFFIAADRGPRSDLEARQLDRALWRSAFTGAEP